QNRKAVFVSMQLPQAIAPLAQVAPILRGACSMEKGENSGAWRRLIFDFRTGAGILNFVNGAELRRYSQVGLVTPDHRIRTKNWPLVVEPPQPGKLEEFAQQARAVAADFMGHYLAYFARHNARVGGNKKPLDPLPRVI